MKAPFFRHTLLALTGLGFTLHAHATLRLAGLFSDHMVLQRAQSDPVWGHATPGERVTVRFGGQTVSTTADANGRWQVELPAMQASAAGRELVVEATDRVVIHDVLVGEVWLCAGQSNMEFPIQGWTHPLHVKQVIATSNRPTIRLIDVPNLASSAPKADFVGHWVPSTPQTVAPFAAAGYFFATYLQGELDVPIGLIEADWGGTAIEPWIPAEGYRDTPQLKADAQRLAHLQTQWQQQAQGYSATAPQHADAAPPTGTLPMAVADNQAPTVLFNGMIAPVVGYGIRGALWYQGEQNATNQTTTYFDDLQALIGSWRARWKQGDFPFIIAQIAPYGGYPNTEDEPRIWEGELDAANSLRHVGLIGTMDIGDLDNIHPQNKQAVGRRFGLWAMANVYGRSALVYSGPTFKSMRVEGDHVVVHFSHVGQGLVSRDGNLLDWFQLAGADGRFVDADARIQADTVVVRAPSIAHPTAVRFGWSGIAMPNLMNREGLPALPFRAPRDRR